MATRWFGPRPLIYVGGDLVERQVHGSCGCCGCGGFYSTDEVADDDRLFTRYAAYRDGVRLKLVIEDVPDAFAVDLSGLTFTEASGMSGYNGTWYFDITKTQYGCILSSTDEETFDIAYRMYDSGFGYDINYTKRVVMGCRISRVGFFLGTIGPIISHYSPDYYSDVMLSGLPYGTNVHPMISLHFEPTDAEYSSAVGITGFSPDGVTYVEATNTGVDSIRLDDVISGNLRFRLSEALIEQDPIDFTNPSWNGIGTFWDTGTSDYKIAGTFTAQLERL